MRRKIQEVDDRVNQEKGQISETEAMSVSGVVNSDTYTSSKLLMPPRLPPLDDAPIMPGEGDLPVEDSYMGPFGGEGSLPQDVGPCVAAEEWPREDGSTSEPYMPSPEGMGETYTEPYTEPYPTEDMDQRLSLSVRQLLRQLEQKLYEHGMSYAEAFLKLDNDRSGSIDNDEFCDALLGYGLDPRHVEEFIEVLDQNNDGSIRYEELCILLDATRREDPLDPLGSGGRSVFA